MTWDSDPTQGEKRGGQKTFKDYIYCGASTFGEVAWKITSIKGSGMNIKTKETAILPLVAYHLD